MLVKFVSIGFGRRPVHENHSHEPVTPHSMDGPQADLDFNNFDSLSRRDRTKVDRTNFISSFNLKPFDVDLEPPDSSIVRRPIHQRHLSQFEAEAFVKLLYIKTPLTRLQAHT